MGRKKIRRHKLTPVEKAIKKGRRKWRRKQELITLINGWDLTPAEFLKAYIEHSGYTCDLVQNEEGIDILSIFRASVMDEHLRLIGYITFNKYRKFTPTDATDPRLYLLYKTLARAKRLMLDLPEISQFHLFWLEWRRKKQIWDGLA